MIPSEHQQSAEHVRAHLVHLRGGAPFLSSNDALCLVRWLDQGVPVPRILAALERCAESRRRNRARSPLSLVAAKRHLGKPPLSAPTQVALDTLQASLDATRDPAAAELSSALGELAAESPEDWITEAAAVCRNHQERRWESLSDGERNQRLQDAIEHLGDLANLIDADTLNALAEEVARDALRKSWPRLDTAVLQGVSP